MPKPIQLIQRTLRPHHKSREQNQQEVETEEKWPTQPRSYQASSAEVGSKLKTGRSGHRIPSSPGNLSLAL